MSKYKVLIKKQYIFMCDISIELEKKWEGFMITYVYDIILCCNITSVSNDLDQTNLYGLSHQAHLLLRVS